MKARQAVSGLLSRGVMGGVLSTVLLSSCAAAPFLVPIAFEFARNLFQTGLSNYGSKHRDNLSNLVNRLSSPYMQGLPPAGGPGQPAQFAQPGAPAQPGMPAAQYPGQGTIPGQPGAYDPNAALSAATPAYPGATTYPGATVNPYGGAGAQGYQTQPGTNPYDPSNPYGGAGAAAPYGQPANPYGQQANPYGQQANPYSQQANPYGQPANPYGSAPSYGQPSNPYGTAAPSPYGSQGAYGSSQSQYGATPNPYGATQNPYGQSTNPSGSTPSPYGSQPSYGGQTPYGSAAPGQPAYDPNNPYGTASAQQGYGQSSTYGQSYGQQQPAYGATSPYGTQSAPQAYGGYGASGQTYGAQSYGSTPSYGGGQQQAYGAGGIYGRGIGAEPVAVDVAMIRQKVTDKGKEVVLMNDGEVLKDGGAKKEAGDRFKIVVRTNCDCYLYITTIDGSGWAEPVFPTSDGKVQNPVKKDQEYAFPADGHWYTLDQVKGIETFFVVASASRRQDLEESFAQLGAEKRPDVKIIAKVEEPPVIPRGVGSVKSRGIIKVQDDTGATLQVTPLSYAAAQSGQDVTVTRWFKHE